MQTRAYGRFMQLGAPVPRLPSFERPDGCSIQVTTPLIPGGIRPVTVPLREFLPTDTDPSLRHDIDPGESIFLPSTTTGAAVAALPKGVYPDGVTSNILSQDEYLQSPPSGLTVVIPGASGGFPPVTTDLPDTPPGWWSR